MVYYLKNHIKRIILAIVFIIFFLALIIAGTVFGFRERHGEAYGNSEEYAEMPAIIVRHKSGSLTDKSVLGKNTLGGNAAEKLIFREIMPEGYSQICQTDYTCFVYEDGFYYFQSASDHLYLYRADELGEKKECLARQIPKELYVVGDWVYFTNLSAGETLYRVGRNGGEPEEVFSQQINRFIPLGEVLYCLTKEGNLYSWAEKQGAKLLYEGDCQWLNTDGTFLYLPMREDEDVYTGILDMGGNVVAQNDAFLIEMIPDRGNMYYLEYSDSDYYIMNSTIEDGKKEELSKVPCFIYESLQGYAKEGNCFYFFCCKDGNGENRDESMFNIYQYDLVEDEWKQCYSKQISNLNFSLIYQKAKNINIVNGYLFYKRPCAESEETWVDGKGELWYKIGIGDWDEELFEDMEPVQVGEAYSMLHDGEKDRGFYQSDDCVYQAEIGNEEGSIAEVDIVLPQFNDCVPAYEVINGHIRADAERFCRKLLEAAEDGGDITQEIENRFLGQWNYMYVYTDERYVSVLYWDCVSCDQQGVAENVYKQYVTKLYSAQTGEELDIEDLFTVSEDELMIRLAYMIRKTFYGMRILPDDFSLLDRNYPQRYYILTDTGIDVILVENLVTKEQHFEISYEDLADVLIR